MTTTYKTIIGYLHNINPPIAKHTARRATLHSRMDLCSFAASNQPTPSQTHTWLQALSATSMLRVTLLNDFKPTSISHHPNILLPNKLRHTLPHHTTQQGSRMNEATKHVTKPCADSTPSTPLSMATAPSCKRCCIAASLYNYYLVTARLIITIKWQQLA